MTKNTTAPKSSSPDEKSSETKADKGSGLVQVSQSKLAVFNNRPIEPSDFEVTEVVNVAGIRPIGSNKFEITHTMYQSGIRPIFASTLQISSNFSVFGNRPVASNDIDNADGLMGFLD